MPTLDFYLGEIKRLGLADLEVTASTELQWKQLRVDLTQKQKDLLLLKSLISQDERALRRADQAARANSRAALLAPFWLLARRSHTSDTPVDARHENHGRQSEQLASFAKTRRHIDDLIMRIDEAKLALEMYLQYSGQSAHAPARCASQPSLTSD
jgi:hypothetical protein